MESLTDRSQLQRLHARTFLKRTWNAFSAIDSMQEQKGRLGALSVLVMICEPTISKIAPCEE